jgi:hypothetical protein
MRSRSMGFITAVHAAVDATRPPTHHAIGMGLHPGRSRSLASLLPPLRPAVCLRQNNASETYKLNQDPHTNFSADNPEDYAIQNGSHL